MDLGDEWGVLMAFLPRLNPFATVNCFLLAGWFLFGISNLIRKMLQLPLGLLITVGSIVRFQQQTPPNLIPLALQWVDGHMDS